MTASANGVSSASLAGALKENEEDLKAFNSRSNEPVLSYETLLEKLKASGRI